MYAIKISQGWEIIEAENSYPNNNTSPSFFMWVISLKRGPAIQERSAMQLHPVMFTTYFHKTSIWWGWLDTWDQKPIGVLAQIQLIVSQQISQFHLLADNYPSYRMSNFNWYICSWQNPHIDSLTYSVRSIMLIKTKRKLWKFPCSCKIVNYKLHCIILGITIPDVIIK